MNVNAAMGAAVSGAGKVAGTVGSIAVAGAKQFLTGLIPKPPGKVRLTTGGLNSLPCLPACLPNLCSGGQEKLGLASSIALQSKTAG